MMTRCPECNSRSQTAQPFCSACFYRFSIADHARSMFETRRIKYRLASIAIGLGVAVLRYAIMS